MNLSEFDFNLPKELIATRPTIPRSGSKLLCSHDNKISDHFCSQLPELLESGDLLVFNDTKVIPALLHGIQIEQNFPKEDWQNFEFLLSKKISSDVWFCLCKPSKKLKLNSHIFFSKELLGKVVIKEKNGVVVKFDYSGDFIAILKEIGLMPLPPYIRKIRPVDKKDDIDYQPVFSNKWGSIASPTASLHFDTDLINRLKIKGIKKCFVTLHVGLGTFYPIRSSNIYDHEMHAEFGEIKLETKKIINNALNLGKRVIAVGTTSLRIIESAASKNKKINSFNGYTNIYITPGFKFKVASGLITNFHLPKSSLFVLVSSFIGFDAAKNVYSHAIENKYKFYSYGDASFLIP